MNTAFTRLVWKEHRAQRSLWLVLLLGCLNIFILTRLRAIPWLESLLTSSSFCILFVVAATAIAFAGEVDDRTVNFLRMLPCRTSTLMMAKLTAIVTGCVTLFLALAALSGVLEVVGLAFPRYWRSDETLLSFDVAMFLPVLIFMTLVSVLTLVASMVTRRVISAVGLAAALCLVCLIPFCVVLVVPAAAVSVFFLARPWHLGRVPRDWITPRSETVYTRTQRLSFLPRSIAVLKRVIAQPMSQSRVRTTLFWRECRSAIPFAATWLMVGIVICVGRYFTFSHDYVWPALFLFVFMHECGQRTMRADQRSGSISLLANMGVSPASIWLTKTLTWFTVLTFVGTVVVLLDAVVPGAHSDHTTHGQELRILQLISSIRTPHVADSRNFARDSTSVDHSLQISTCVAYVLMTFSIGQLTACWIQRQILAFAASLLLFCGAGFLIHLCSYLDYSAWITVVPVGFFLLLATLFTARRWIDRTATWKLRLVQGAWIILPCCVFVGVGRIVWYYEPAFVTQTNIRNLSFGMDDRNPVVREVLEPLEKSMMIPTSEWKTLVSTASRQIWSEFDVALAGSAYKSQLTPPLHGWQIEPNQALPLYVTSNEHHYGVRELLQIFEEHLAVNKKWPMLPVSWTAPWSNTPAPAVTYLLLADAADREKQGDIGGAIRQHLNAIRLCQSLANQTSSWKNWTACVTSEQAALSSLRQLLGSADLTGVDLNAVFEELNGLLVYWQAADPRIMLRRRLVFWGRVASESNALRDIRGESPEQKAFAGELSAVKELEDEIAEMSEATRYRALSTMNLSFLVQNTEWSGVNLLGRVALSDHNDASIVASIVSASQAVQRFAATSTIGDLKEDPTMVSDRLDPRLFPATVNLIAEERATLITVLLHRHRMMHGRFSDSLLELADGDELISMRLTDPWSGTMFFYAPKGLTKPVRLGFENEQYRIAAGQPLLFSAGRFARPLNQYLQDSPRQDGEPYSVATLPPNLILFVGLDDRVQRFPLHNRVLEIKAAVRPTAEEEVSSQENMSAGATDGASSEAEGTPTEPFKD
ncbi:MAG: hypothetical protein U0936_21230 [Planctomycetaceae bacterium]